MPEPAVRAATFDDLERILALLAASKLPSEGVADLAGARGGHILLAEQCGELLAVAALELYGECGLLRSVAVSPARRGGGLASTLVRRLLDDATRAGLRAVYLLTTTADGYFPRFGFERVARDEVPEAVRASEQFTSVCPASASVMVRRLVA